MRKLTNVVACRMAVFLLLSLAFVSCQSVNTDEALERTRPEENRFTKVVLAENLDEPMQFKIFPDGRVLFVERKGRIRVYDPATDQVSVIGEISVSTGYYSESGEVLSPTGEDGMQGVAVDPNYDKNHWIYLYYSPKDSTGSILTRYTWDGGMIDTTSKRVLLEVPNQRISCCHLGGGMLFDADSNLLLTTGDNTPNDPRGYVPLDERPGRSRFDSQRTSGNTNDLRGKILRIHPEPDGTYSIPEGNLFPEGTPNTRPEIYTMGNRNPWRLSIDSETGWLYWGEVGPHGTEDSVGMGPRSYDEFNQARAAGNFGWPYFIADNKAYWEYDYEAEESGQPFDPERPVNDSPNNTGLRELPPAQPAMIWYPQSAAVDFPLMGSGSNSAVGGPIYHRADFQDPERPFPQYYEGKWLITDWTRGWIMAVTMDEEGDFASMEEFAPGIELSGPVDMDFGPEGDLYVLEYGRTPYQRNPDARLSRIEYNAGNRSPIVHVAANKTAAAAPATIELSSAGTVDHDGDSLSYEWEITSDSVPAQRVSEANPTVTLEEPGTYRAQLTVSDGEGHVTSEPIEIAVGNEPPTVAFDFNGRNKSFYFDGTTINYAVRVSDREDGSLSDGTIDPSRVAVSIEYVPSISDARSTLPALQDVDASVSVKTVRARQLMGQSDCAACHTMNTQSLGPPFVDIAEKYRRDPEATGYLAQKIVEGGSGVWGATAMPAHPALQEEEARAIAEYILDLSDQTDQSSFPVEGSYEIAVPEQEGENGSFAAPESGAYVFRAFYTDDGTDVAAPRSSSAVVLLRSPVITVSEVDRTENMQINHQINAQFSTATPKGSGAYLVIQGVDLSGIEEIAVSSPTEANFSASGSGRIEIRLGSPSGKLIGQTTLQFSSVDNAPGRYGARAVVDIEQIDGVHDVYIVLTNLKDLDLQEIEVGNIRFIANL